jgi:hypothetical protein
MTLEEKVAALERDVATLRLGRVEDRKEISQLQQTIVRMKALARGPKGDKGDPGPAGKVLHAKSNDTEFRIPMRWRTEQRPDGTCYHTPEYD